MNHTGHALPASGRRSAPQTCCSADCRCLSWAASPERVSSSRRGLPHQGHRDPSLSLLFLPSMGRGWSRAPSCPRQEGNSARGESDLGKEAGLELNSALLPHSHHAPPQGSPPGPLGPFASWEVALRGLSGSVLSRRTSFLLATRTGSSSLQPLEALHHHLHIGGGGEGLLWRPHFASLLAPEDPQFLAPSL